MKKFLKLLCLVAVAAALLLTAAWADSYSVTVNDSNISVSPSTLTGTAEAASCTVNLIPAEGYEITNVTNVSVAGADLEKSAWSCDNNAAVTIKNYTGGNVAISATAEVCSYKITLKVGNGTDTHTTAPSFAYGAASVTINDPTPPTGYTFVGWTVTGKEGNWTDVSSSLADVPAQDYVTLNTTEKYGNLELTAQYETGKLYFVNTDEMLTGTVGTTKTNVLTIKLAKDVDEDEYDLPLFVTVTKADGTVLTESFDVDDDDKTWEYTYDHDDGTVTINKSILNTTNVTVSADADPIKEDSIYVEFEGSGVVLTSGKSWARTDKKYELEFRTAGTNVKLPAYATAALVIDSDDLREVECTYTVDKDGTTGSVLIDKSVLDELYNDESLQKKNGTFNENYYLLITVNAAAEGKVKLTTMKGNSYLTGTKTSGVEMTLEAALTQISDDIEKNADSAEIELLGNCTTSKQIKVAEDFELEITSEDDYILTSTYVSKKAAKNYAIVLEEDAKLDLDIAGLYYAADVAIYDEEADEDEEDVTSDLYPSAMTITGEELDGTYLLSEDGYGFAEALTIAKTAAKTCGEEVVLTVRKGKYTEKSAAVTLPEDVAVTLEKSVELTLKKALNLNGQTLTVFGTLTLKGVSGKGGLTLAGSDAGITCDTSIKDYVSSTLPLDVSEQSENGVYTYTLNDKAEEKPEMEQAEEAEETAATQSGTISISCGAGGTVSPASFTLAQGQSQIVTITTGSGYTLSSLTINGRALSSAEMNSLLLETTTGYILSWNTAEDTSIVLGFVTLPSFTDVISGTWYYSDVMYAASRGLMVGYSDGSFGATETMTVAQYLTVMYRYLQAQAPSLIPAKSTTGNTWTEGADYVNTTFLSGLYQNITTTQLTRYAVADITYRVLKTVESYTGTSYGTGEVLSFSDVPLTDTYYNAVSYLSTVNILDGYLTGTVRTYAGSNTMSRVEIAKVLHRLMLAQPV